MNRGINKWLYCRLMFIDLKHEVKDMLRTVKTDSEIKLLRHINEKMQNIARTPRWVEWGTHVYKNMKNNKKEIKIRGKHC